MYRRSINVQLKIPYCPSSYQSTLQQLMICRKTDRYVLGGLSARAPVPLLERSQIDNRKIGAFFSRLEVLLLNCRFCTETENVIFIAVLDL